MALQEKSMLNKEKIESVSQYLQWVKERHQVEQDGVSFDQSRIYYRGQADQDWDLVPGVFRKKDNGNYYNEKVLLQQARKDAWQEIKGCRSELEELVLYQHMGLKTRLLDTTSNPLVALFMACCESNNTPGCVYVFYPRNDTDFKYAELMAKATFHLTADIIDDHVLQQFADSQSTVPNIDELKVVLSKPAFIEVPLSNPRITAQRGAFIIAPVLRQVGGSWMRQVHCDMDYRTQEDSGLDEHCALIPCHKKSEIMNDLAELGIDESTLFPDLPHIMEAINKGRYDKSLCKDCKLDL